MLLPRYYRGTGFGVRGRAGKPALLGVSFGVGPMRLFYIIGITSLGMWVSTFLRYLITIMSEGGKIGAPPRTRPPKAFAQTNPEPRAELDTRGGLTTTAPEICCFRVTMSASSAGLTTTRGRLPAHVIACRWGRVVSPRPRASLHS